MFKIPSNRGGPIANPGGSNEPPELANFFFFFFYNIIFFFCFTSKNKNLNTLTLNFV